LDSNRIKQDLRHKSRDSSTVFPVKTRIREATDQNQMLLRLQKDLEDENMNLRNHLSVAEKIRVEEISLLKTNITDLQHRIEESDRLSHEERLRSKLLLKDIKDKSNSAISYLEARLSDQQSIHDETITRTRYAFKFLFGLFCFHLLVYISSFIDM